MENLKVLAPAITAVGGFAASNRATERIFREIAADGVIIVA